MVIYGNDVMKTNHGQTICLSTTPSYRNIPTTFELKSSILLISLFVFTWYKYATFYDDAIFHNIFTTYLGQTSVVDLFKCSLYK